MGDEMNRLFKKMGDRFIMIRVNLFPTLVTKFTLKPVATIFTDSRFVNHEQVVILVREFPPAYRVRYLTLAPCAVHLTCPWCGAIQ